MPAKDPSVEVVVLGAIGALLMFANGVADVVFGSAELGPLQYEQNVVLAGLLGMLFAVLLGFFLGAYWESHRSDDLSLSGMLIVIVAALSLWAGGGFVVGFVLALTAGALAIVLARFPDVPPDPLAPGLGRRAARTGRSNSSPPGDPPRNETRDSEGPAPAWTPGLGPGVWFCRKCGLENRFNSASCSSCGEPRSVKG